MADVYIRELKPEDWHILKDIRIRALNMHPDYFSCTPETAESYPEEHWRETLDGKGKLVLGLFDKDRIVGITAVFTCKDDRSGQTGRMAFNFIEPEHRGKGYSALFYEARFEFAKNHTPWTKLKTGHRAGNEASRCAILKHGFEPAGTEEIDWPDGARDIEYKYELDLTKLKMP